MYFRCSENWANKKKAAALEVGRFPPLKLQRHNESGVWTFQVVTRQIIVKIEQKFSIKKKNTLPTQFPTIVMIDFRATLPSGSKDKNQFVYFCDNVISCLKITSGVATCDTDAHGLVVIIEHGHTMAHRHGCSHVKLTCVYIFHNNAFLNQNTSGSGFHYRFFAK